MHHVEGLEQGRGYWYTPENPGAAFFEAFEHQHARCEIDPVGGQCQRFGQPAAGIGEGHAKCPHGTVGLFGFAQEAVAFAGGQIFAESIGGMQLHADLWGRGGRLGCGGTRLRAGRSRRVMSRPVRLGHGALTRHWPAGALRGSRRWLPRWLHHGRSS
jgi:hypothetical protein